MENPVKPIGLNIPANKFYPPPFVADRNLFREKLIRHTLQKANDEIQVIAVAGQAGQGKTTLALQYLHFQRHRFAWYQCGEEDRDPVFFVTALLHCLKGVFPDFSSPWAEEMISSKAITVPDLRGVLNLLLRDLDAVVPQPFYLVFDDMHLLGGESFTARLIDHLLDTSPPKIRYFLLSRHPFDFQSKVMKFGRRALRLANNDLQLNHEEIHTLFNEVLDAPITLEMARILEEATDGWAMGLIMVGHALEGKGSGEIEPAIRQILCKGAIRDYFLEEIFHRIPPDMQHTLQLLSLLGDIALPLAENVCHDDMIGDKLRQLVEHNLFVRRLDGEGRIFGFHHLFQQFLRQEAEKNFSKNEIRAVLREAARFCLDHAMPDSALRYLLRAGDFAQMEQVVKREGMVFLANNWNVTLYGLLSEVPGEVLQQHGWLTLFKGLAQYDIFPRTSLELLIAARQLLQQQAEEVGELLAIGQIILYHWIISGHLHDGARYLPRAEELYNRVRDKLSPYEKILITRNIAAGHCYFRMDMPRARHYSAQAMELARRCGIRNFVGSILLLQGYEDFLVARRDAYRPTLEAASDMACDPGIGTVAQLGLLTLRINELEAYGDFENYFAQENMLQERVGREVIKQTIIGPFLHIWRAGIHVALGQPAQALQTLESSLEGGEAALNPHLRSQILHWQALALAMLQQDTEKAEQVAEESIRLRTECGGPFFVTMNKIVAGAAFVWLHRFPRAEIMLSEAVREAAQLPNDYLGAAALLSRCYCRLLAGDQETCLADLRQGLAKMRENGFVYCWSLTPPLLHSLLSLAVREKVEADYARRLAAARLHAALLDDGTEIPLLAVTVLGPFGAAMNGRQILTARDLSQAQRQLFGLLLASPEQRISQEKVQLLMWPDSPPAQARSKFDTLLSRLRKIFAAALHPHPEKHYLYLRKGILCLDHCRIDAEIFREKIKKGLRYDALQEFWHAGNHLFPAMKLWDGCLAGDIFSGDLVQEYCAELQRLMIAAAKKCGAYLSAVGSPGEAIRLAEKALGFDPLDSGLVQMLYHLYLAQGGKIRAKGLLRQYEMHLADHDFSPAERAELLLRVQSVKPIE
jgi:ATP/maltotriose-dependent transcriptional regulator MalT/DNA-binding SARP family transcriptional activator